MPDNCLDPRRSITVIQHSADPSEMAIENVNAGEIISTQAQSDAQLIDLWVHGRSRHTQRAYRADAQRLLRFLNKNLHSILLADLQAFSDALDATRLIPASRNRILAAVKSLFSFGHRLGYLPFDVAPVLKLAAVRDGLAERILSEGDIQRMIAMERNPRNRTLLMTLYSSGCRVSEITGLRWRDVQRRTEGGQIVVMGKRGKTRSILIPSSIYSAIYMLQGSAEENDPVFRSRRHRALSASQILRIVKRSARQAGLQQNCVVHTFRHCHASHSLERGAPIHLVQTTLGHSSVSTTSRYLHARPSDSSSQYLPL